MAEIDQPVRCTSTTMSLATSISRLTRILRAVGSATREAGMLPQFVQLHGGSDDQTTGFIRFGIHVFGRRGVHTDSAYAGRAAVES